MRRVNTAKRFSGQKGGALVDAAIAIPVLVLLFAGITDVLSMLDTKAKVQAAASELQSLRLEVPMEIVKGHVRPMDLAAQSGSDAIVLAASRALDGVSEYRRSYDPQAAQSQAVVENFVVQSQPVVVPIDVDEDSPTFLFSEAPSVGNIGFTDLDIAEAIPMDDFPLIQSGFDVQMQVLVESEIRPGVTRPSIRIGRSNLNISLNDTGSSSDKDVYSDYYSSAFKAMPAEVAYFYRLGLAHEDLTVGSLINLDERPAVVEGVLFASLQPRFAPDSIVTDGDSYQLGAGFNLPGIAYDRPVVVPNWEDRGTGGGGEDPPPPGSSGGGSKPGVDVHYNATGDYGQPGGACTAVEPEVAEQVPGVVYDYNSDFWGTGTDGTAYIGGACGGGGAGTTDTGVNADVEVPAPPNPYSGCVHKPCGGTTANGLVGVGAGDTNVQG